MHQRQIALLQLTYYTYFILFNEIYIIYNIVNKIKNKIKMKNLMKYSRNISYSINNNLICKHRQSKAH